MIIATTQSYSALRVVKRPFYVSLGWTLRDYGKRVWDNSGEDNVLFLAGGIAFNLLLAAVPFVLLLATGITFVLPLLFHKPVNGTAEVAVFIHRLLPAHTHGVDCVEPFTDPGCSSVDKLVGDLLRTRRTLTIYSAVGFVCEALERRQLLSISSAPRPESTIRPPSSR